MKKLLLVCSLIVGVMFGNQYVDQYRKDFKKLDDSQFKVMKEIYKRAKNYDLVYSALAIAWQESNFGKWSINLQDPSCGPFHQTLTNYMKKYKIQMTDFNQNRVCMNLVNDINVAVSEFIAQFEFWLKVHEQRWNKFEYAFRSYNAGYNYDTKRSKDYALRIQARIKVLKENIESAKIRLARK